MFLETDSYSMCVKKLIKVLFSEGGGIQFNFFLKGDCISWRLLQKIYFALTYVF